MSEESKEMQERAPDGAVPIYMRDHLLYVHPRPWRVGRKVARNVYDANNEGVAMFTHAFTAAIVVAAVNDFRGVTKDLLAPDGASLCDERRYETSSCFRPRGHTGHHAFETMERLDKPPKQPAAGPSSTESSEYLRGRERGIEEAARRWREAVRVYFDETERCEECGVLPWEEREFVARCKACDPLRALLSAEPQAAAGRLEGNAEPQATPLEPRFEHTHAETFRDAAPPSPLVVQENQELKDHKAGLRPASPDRGES